MSVEQIRQLVSVVLAAARPSYRLEQRLNSLALNPVLCPRYTRSIEQAARLLPPGATYRFEQARQGTRCAVSFPLADGTDNTVTATAEQLPVALAAACLRALVVISGEQRKLAKEPAHP